MKIGFYAGEGYEEMRAVITHFSSSVDGLILLERNLLLPGNERDNFTTLDTKLRELFQEDAANSESKVSSVPIHSSLTTYREFIFREDGQKAEHDLKNEFKTYVERSNAHRTSLLNLAQSLGNVFFFPKADEHGFCTFHTSQSVKLDDQFLLGGICGFAPDLEEIYEGGNDITVLCADRYVVCTRLAEQMNAQPLDTKGRYFYQRQPIILTGIDTEQDHYGTWRRLGSTRFIDLGLAVPSTGRPYNVVSILDIDLSQEKLPKPELFVVNSEKRGVTFVPWEDYFGQTEVVQTTPVHTQPVDLDGMISEEEHDRIVSELRAEKARLVNAVTEMRAKYEGSQEKLEDIYQRIEDARVHVEKLEGEK